MCVCVRKQMKRDIVDTILWLYQCFTRHAVAMVVHGQILKMEKFLTLNATWTSPWIGPHSIPSRITHQPLTTHQISLESEKLFVDGRTDVRTYLWTDIEAGFIRSTRKSRPNKTSQSAQRQRYVDRNRYGRLTWRSRGLLWRICWRIVGSKLGFCWITCRICINCGWLRRNASGSSPNRSRKFASYSCYSTHFYDI